jgi:hypothetical protein
MIFRERMNAMRPLLLAAVLLASCAAAEAAPDWATVPAKTVTLFYPGQYSLELAMTPAEHKGADRFRGGKSCASCHTGEEKAIGNSIVSGKYDKAPLRGKPGSLAAKVQVARDAANLYVHVEFSDAGQPDARMDKATAKVAMMLDGGGVPEAARAGCWAMCHDDAATMASGNAVRTMYLSKTRAKLTRQGGGDGLSPTAAKLKAGGYALEYWQAALNPAPKAANGVVSEKRGETRTVVSAEARRTGSVWSVTLSRKLNAGQVALVPGKRYSVAFAIDTGHTAQRFHYVSFERSLLLGSGVADFVVK